MYEATAEEFLGSEAARLYCGRVDLIFTSPPFPLNRKKSYGNLQGDRYVEWLAGLAPQLSDLLGNEGSIVIELGNAWERGSPTMSTLALEALLAFRRKAELFLCQQFICHNPNRLPTPAQWVTVTGQRVTDAHTHVWWFAKTPTPKADNRKVLRQYSKAMVELLERQSYNAGTRPSEHYIGEESLLKNNGGAIPSSVLIFFPTQVRKLHIWHIVGRRVSITILPECP